MVAGSPLADRVFETTTTQGTGALTLLGAQTGYRSFATAFGNGGQCDAVATDGTDWEVFKGTVTVGGSNTLSRDTVYASSNGGAAVNWGAGTRNVFCTPSAALLQAILDPGFRPHAEATPAMTVRLDAGKLFDGATLTNVAAQSTGAITAPVGNPRIDRVVVDRITGAVSVITGTPAGSPAPPAITAGKLPVAQVLLQTSSTVITDSMITDERVLGFAAGNLFTGGTLTSTLTMSGAAINEALVATVASAATVDLGALAGNHVHITGTTTITAFGGTGPVGARRKFVFDGALTLTNNANIILPGGANITTAAGDCGEAVCESVAGSGIWRVENFVKASGQAIVLSGVFTKSYDSGDQTITAAGALTLAHGMGVAPKIIQHLLHCVTGELGYSAGDFVFINPHDTDPNGGPASRGIAVVPDATNLNVRFGSDTVLVDLLNKGTGTGGNITNANWKYVVRAYA
jgi:hypothetical protein